MASYENVCHVRAKDEWKYHLINVPCTEYNHSYKKYFMYKLLILIFCFFRSLNDGECSADWYNFQESVAHLQLLEEEVRYSFRSFSSVFDRIGAFEVNAQQAHQKWQCFDFGLNNMYFGSFFGRWGTPFIQDRYLVNYPSNRPKLVGSHSTIFKHVYT